MKKFLVAAVLIAFCCSTALSFGQTARTRSGNQRNAARGTQKSASENANKPVVEEEEADEEEVVDDEEEIVEGSAGDKAADNNEEKTLDPEKVKGKVKDKITVEPNGVIKIGEMTLRGKTVANLCKRLSKEDPAFAKEWKDYLKAWNEYEDAVDEYIRVSDITYKARKSLRDNPFIVDAESTSLYQDTFDKDNEYAARAAAKRKVWVKKRSVILEHVVIVKGAMLEEAAQARDAKSDENDRYLAEHNKPLDDIVKSDLELEEAFAKDLQDNYKEFAKEYKTLQASIANYQAQADEFADKANHTMTKKYDDLKKEKEEELVNYFKKWIKDVYGPNAYKRAKAERAKLEKEAE